MDASRPAASKATAHVQLPRESHLAQKLLSRKVSRLAAAAFLLAATGCASIPKSNIAATQIPELSCDPLGHELILARDSEAAADKARRDSWKVVLPVLAAGRYAYAANAKQEATKRIALIEQQMQLKNCPPAQPVSQSQL